MKRKLLLLLFIGVCYSVYGKDDIFLRVEKVVLSEKNTGNTYSFSDRSAGSICEYEITYIGQVKNVQFGTLDFLFVAAYTGQYEDSRRCRSAIVVYRSGTRYGEYGIGGRYATIPRVEGNQLVVTSSGDSAQVSKIDFGEGIPPQIFIAVGVSEEGVIGDFYTFQKSKGAR